MIRALWLHLSEIDIVHNASEAALGAFVKRMTGVDALQWLSTKQASQVIENLKQWLTRTEIDRLTLFANHPTYLAVPL